MGPSPSGKAEVRYAGVNDNLAVNVPPAFRLGTEPLHTFKNKAYAQYCLCDRFNRVGDTLTHLTK